MDNNELKKIENKLWQSADDLRANSKLKPTEYSMPVLGLIFLRQAFSRFKVAESEILKTLPSHPIRGTRPIEKHDFRDAKALYLPENARWEIIINQPESIDIGEYVNDAMKSIEKENPSLEGVLPNTYQLFEKDLLFRVLRVFNDPALENIPGDAFGRIYEYFLNKFAQNDAQEGGEFFTPPSLVNTIVNIIEPTSGIVYDPSVGSAGMFVQTSYFLEEKGFNPSDKVTFYGQEKTTTNTRLAKMNMAVHGLDSRIVEGNSYYVDKHNLLGKCSFVMANPPFNVDGIDKSNDKVKNDNRLPFGLPKNDNANYMWIQYFYSYLSENGRAGFVMASSASDAGHSEKTIRQNIVDTGCVDVMVTIGNKFFYTRSLPCSLWFFDRSKEGDDDRKDQTLMLDLRNYFRKVSTNLHDFSEGQLLNVRALVGLYRGDDTYYKKAIEKYEEEGNKEDLAWLKDKFGDGKYADIKGLCKIVDRSEIAENDYSLTPGRYVDVEDQLDHDFDYKTRMGEIKEELNELNNEAEGLARQIQTNLDELGL
tara:strand:+ start:155 stop:1762 length:1608 start_codon:yes stop_codon:yes gene_type:complete